MVLKYIMYVRNVACFFYKPNFWWNSDILSKIFYIFYNGLLCLLKI